ncbi:hypothetical protein C0416_02495 [bacterium]|nr:hypothetical protein [bacterium]
MFKNLCSFILIVFLSSIFLSGTVFAATVLVTGQIRPQDATNFVATAINPGNGECSLAWTTSITSNIDTQRIEIDGPQGPGVSFTTKNLIPFPGSLAPDNYSNYAPGTDVIGLVVGWTYIIRHVSVAGVFESPGVWTSCTPTSTLPAPVMAPEPATTVGTSNSVSWTNGGITDPTLECKVQVSTTDLNIDPLTFAQESAWIPCPTAGTTYQHTFSGLTLDTTYFYHVQSQTVADGLSPFSNVVYSTQITSSGGGGGGGTITPVCGNNIKQFGEQCDDGNITPGDGCSATCQNEPAPVCGNNSTETGETCDDGNTVSGDGCSATCTTEAPIAPICGNNSIETGETCDDGNTVSGDGCSNTCDTEHGVPEEQECGNGAIEEGEDCDDGNHLNGDGCDRLCQFEDELLPVCGNSVVEDPEQCDDGNLANNDGCSSTCEREDIVTVRFEIKGAPEFRVKHAADPNLSLNSEFLVYKPSINDLGGVRIKLDDFGNAVYEGEIVIGNYDFGLNGEAHNTKLIRGIEITPTTEVVTLDFTYAETVKLTAGDTIDDNYINGVDLSKLINEYSLSEEVLSDLNKDEDVNGIDLSIIIANYRKAGERF